jgi:hypothetical protein
MPAKLIEYFNKSPAAVTFEEDGVRPIVNFGQVGRNLSEFSISIRAMR